MTKKRRSANRPSPGVAQTIKTFYPCLTVTAGNLPANNATPWWSGEDGVGGAGAASTRASLDCGTKGAGAFDTEIEAHFPGSAGNAKTFALAADAATFAPGSGAEYITISGNAIVLHFTPNVSTVLACETAITDYGTTGSGLQPVLNVKTPGTPGTVLLIAHVFGASALTGGLSCEGHKTVGLVADEFRLHVTIEAFDGQDGIELLLQSSLAADEGYPFGHVEPWPLLNPVDGRFLAKDGSGRLYIPASTYPTGETICIPFRLAGAKRLRVGVRAHSGGARANVALSASLECIQSGLYA